ncbi:DUF192 domain-containing protein [Candidatus Collierbacteria bacterium]|nr:DUF192 domain-containing protein [Candidatus Collierbacteria bacterium]
MHKTRLVLFSLILIIAGLFATKAIQNIQKQTLNSSPAAIAFPVTISPTPTETAFQPEFGLIKVGNTELNVEIASTPEKAQKGLSDRNEIGSDGMLFEINPPRQTAFWMKDMMFPLDIIWISGNKITGIDKNVPIPPTNATDDKLPLYNSPSSVNYVLELPAGTVSKLKIDLSSQISIPPTNNQSPTTNN